MRATGSMKEGVLRGVGCCGAIAAVSWVGGQGCVRNLAPTCVVQRWPARHGVLLCIYLWGGGG